MSGRKPGTRYRVRYVGRQHTDTAFVLPGGRWLVTKTGGFHCVGALYLHITDLDQPEPQPRILFKLEDIESDGLNQHEWSYSYWVEEGDNFSVRLLVYNYCHEEREKPQPPVRIYRLAVVGHGLQARLEAILLKSFQSTPFSTNDSAVRFTLNQQYMVRIRTMIHRSFLPTPSSPKYLDIFPNYMDPDMHDLSTPITIQIEPVSKVLPIPHILPGNRIILCSDILKIYNIPSETNDIVSTKAQNTISLPKTRNDGFCHVITSDNWYTSSSGDTYFTLLNEGIFHTVRISTCTEHPFHIQRLEPGPQHEVRMSSQTTLALDLCNSFLVDTIRKRVTQISYPVHVDGSRYALKEYRMSDPDDLLEVWGDVYQFACGVDETSGRIITMRGTYFLVFDLIP